MCSSLLPSIDDVAVSLGCPSGCVACTVARYLLRLVLVQLVLAHVLTSSGTLAEILKLGCDGTCWGLLLITHLPEVILPAVMLTHLFLCVHTSFCVSYIHLAVGPGQSLAVPGTADRRDTRLPGRNLKPRLCFYKTDVLVCSILGLL